MPALPGNRIAFSATVLVLTVLTAGLLPLRAQVPSLEVAHVNGVELHYITAGGGEPVIFVHGALDDYRMWAGELAPFAQHYRAISYSRRYNYPNKNGTPIADYSGSVDADDLAALIKQLDFGPVHIVAHSYGGYAALFLAVRHPEVVRTLVLAEPAMVSWIRDNLDAQPLFMDQMNRLWAPVREAFNRGDAQDSLRIAFEYFEGKGAYDSLPAEARGQLRQNLTEWRALALSREAFPTLPMTDVAKIDKPVLLMTGENTWEIFRLIDTELQKRLPRARHVIIPNAKHEMWAANPEACREAALSFLAPRAR